MKLLKVIPFTYLPISQDQNLDYFSDNRNTTKFSLVLMKVRNSQTLGLVKDILDIKDAKIYLKKYYNYELKSIDKIIELNPILNEDNFNLLKLVEHVWLQPKSILLNYFFPKDLFLKKSEVTRKIKSTYFYNDFELNDTFKKIKEEIEGFLKNEKNIICIFPQISSLYYYIPFFQKYFEKQFKEVLRINKKEFQETYFNLNKSKGKIFLSIGEILFYPLKDIGAIYIFDEENPNYNRMLDFPKFDIKKIALIYSNILKCDIKEYFFVFPSFDYYFQHKNESIKYLDKIDVSSIKIFENSIDKNKENSDNYFNQDILEEIKDILKNNGNIIILQNRKGFSVFVKCLDCEHVFYCKNCDVPLKLHEDRTILKCHYCGFETKIPTICPICKGFSLRILGTGIEKIENILKDSLKLKDIKFFTIDLDILKTKKSKADLIEKIQQSKKSIVIGTTSVLDLRLGKFDLAIIPNIDLFFNFPGYNRIMEILYSIGCLKTMSKKLLIQTFGESLDFLAKLKENITEIYKEEENFRRDFSWPPFVDLTKITYGLADKSKSYSRVILEKDKIKYLLREYSQDLKKSFKILGPNEDLIFKKKNKYYYNILIKTPKTLRKIKNEIIRKINPDFRIEVEV